MYLNLQVTPHVAEMDQLNILKEKFNKIIDLRKSCGWEQFDYY